MNKTISTLIMAMILLTMIACGGGQSSSSKQDEVTATEKQKQDSVREANAEAERIKKEQEEQARLEAERIKKEQEEQERLEAERRKKEWHGANSRSDLKAKLNGTTWETTSAYSVTGLHYKFVISGNSVRMYSARPTRNYDDPKDWSSSFDMVIEDIAEPQQGLYCVICKAVDDTDARGAVPTFLVFQGETATYSLGGDKGPNLKKIN